MNLIKTVIMIAAVGLVSACSSDSTTSTAATTGDGGTGAAISINTVKGVTHTLEGIYLSECYSTPDGRIDSHLYNGSTVVISASIFTGDVMCQSTPTVSTITATMTIVGPAAITGWSTGDGAGSTFPPDAADGSGPLAPDETVTIISLKLVQITGDQFDGVAVGDDVRFFHVVDDTGTGILLYGDTEAESGMEVASPADPLTQQ